MWRPRRGGAPGTRPAAALVLPLVAGFGCTGYSASHGPGPVAPGHSVLAAGLSVITDAGETGVMPEASYRIGLTDRADVGLEVAGVSVMVDGLVALQRSGDRFLSVGLGVSATAGSSSPTLHPELYYGSDRLFVAARPMVLLSESSGDGDWDVPTAAAWPGLSMGTTLGRPDCVHLLPTVSAFFDETTVLVFTVNLRYPRGYDCD